MISESDAVPVDDNIVENDAPANLDAKQSKPKTSALSRVKRVVKHSLFLLVFSTCIFPPSILFWIFMACSALGLNAVTDFFSNVGFISNSLTMGGSTANVFIKPHISLLGLTLWVPLSLAGAWLYLVATSFGKKSLNGINSKD